MNKLLLALAALAMSWGLSAEELKTTADERTSLSLTIYNGGRALVRDARLLSSDRATREVAFMDVAEKIMPQTVSISGLTVREQNYDYDLLSPQALVEKNIGQRVRIARRSSETGETLEWSRGVILSNNGGIVLRMDDGSLESLAGQDFYHMVFDEIPDKLRTSPTLSLLLAEPFSGEREVDITYLTGGMSWTSDYVLQLDDSGKRARLDSWITLDNQSGIEYRDARLQLLAGDVNLERPQPRMAMRETMAMQARVMEDVSEQALHGYHLYSVPFATTLRNRQSKQIRLFSRDHITVQKSLRDRAHVNTHGGREQKTKPQQLLLLTNRAPALGLPLPKGVVRVYAPDDSGNNQFLGEDGIGHIAVNDEFEIHLGQSFDVTIERKTRGLIQRSKSQQQLSRELIINNGSKQKQVVELSEIMPTHQWSVISASQAHDVVSPTEALFRVEVPALGKVSLGYEVLLTYP